MVVVDEVAEFMHHHILDAVHGGVDEAEIEGDPSGSRTAPPTSAHFADRQDRFMDAVPAGDFHAGSQVAVKHVVGSRSIPGIDDRFD